jgi:hypothetical protein
MQYDYQKEPNFRNRCMIGERSMEIEENSLQKLLSFEYHRQGVSCHSPTIGCLCDVNKRDWKIQCIL